MIQVLEKHIADKIAAGEVIDRPVSIIKELVENAIDAGSSSVTVEIRNGGKSYIRVTDNGCGIEADEVETAFKRHATSKITDVADLDHIGTLGFRGEALASIAAVSRTELITRPKDARVGRKLVIEGSIVTENAGTGCPEGTTITVRDLFYNTPARRKFLASDNAESRRITELMSRLALSYSDIKFTLLNGSKPVFSTGGRGNILQNIISIYGADTGKDLIPVERTRDGYILKGFISSPATTLPSRNREIFCVNGRVISSSVLQNALEEGYKEKLFGGRFPLAFLFLYAPPERLDVNIHPTKREIRFEDEHEVFDFVREGIRQALGTLAAVPEVSAKEHGRAEPYEMQPQEAPETGMLHEKPFEYQQKTRQETQPSRPVYRAEPEGEQVNINSVLESMRAAKESVQEMTEELEQTVSETLLSPAERAPFDFDSLQTIGSVFNTYILATDGASFFMIDQHAAHERVFYEQFVRQYESGERLSQQLLIPLQIGASAAVCDTEEDWIPVLRNAGYDIEFFGQNTYLIREIPAFMTLEEGESFVRDLMDEVEHAGNLKNQKVMDRIITRSCKSAVKGGDVLHAEEIEALMAELKACVNPFSCPHGRPTFIRMRKYEIEKMFKRV